MTAKTVSRAVTRTATIEITLDTADGTYGWNCWTCPLTRTGLHPQPYGADGYASRYEAEEYAQEHRDEEHPE